MGLQFKSEKAFQDWLKTHGSITLVESKKDQPSTPNPSPKRDRFGFWDVLVLVIGVLSLLWLLLT